MLNLLKQDPNYVKNQNFELLHLEKNGWKPVEQSSVNWNNVTEDNYSYLLRQKPGNINVLGPIKFAIVNPYDIFLHSTSEPWLFSNNFKGYSSGCIRLEDPIEFSKFIIKHGDVPISEEDFEKLYHAYDSKDGIPMPQKPELNEKYFKFKKPIPTYITYISVFANEDGTVTLLDDIYNLDYNQARLAGL
jgi:murein L,D-transpeptidase YcbB/YkuD